MESMEKVKECTLALVEAIRESEAYKGFAAAKAELDENPELREKVTAFRRRNYELQNRDEGRDLYAEMERIEAEYHEVRKNPVISEYLKMELELCRMLQRIDHNLVRAVDPDVRAFSDIIQL